MTLRLTEEQREWVERVASTWLNGATGSVVDKAKGVTIVPDDISAAERSTREAAGEIVVTETEAKDGPADFDG